MAKVKRYRYPKHEGTVTSSELRKLPKSEKLEVMRIWFYDNYEDPVHNSPWVDGEYIYLHGGPYEAQEELDAEFGGVVSESLINELTDELNSDCDTWAGRPEYEPDYDEYPWSSTEPADAFRSTIKSTKSLLTVAVSSANKQHFLRLQYASVITALETFLSDFFISTITTNQSFFRKFVETNKDFEDHKFTLNKVYSEYFGIQRKVEDYLRDVIWHNLAKVEKFYFATLGVQFPEMKKLYEAVSIRHDIVHRSGKTKAGKEHQVTKVQVQNLIAQTDTFVTDILAQWQEIEKADSNSFFGLRDENDDS